MNWDELYTGKFFSGGATAYDEAIGEYRHAKHNTELYLVSVFETTDNNTLYKNVDKYSNSPSDLSIRPSMYRMMRYLSKETRTELHSMYEIALTEASKHFSSWYASGLVIVPPGISVSNHKHFNDPNKFTFTYVFSSQHNDNNSSIITEETIMKMNPKDKEFYFCIDSSKNHSTTREPEDSNGYLYFTFDDVDITNLPFNLNELQTVR